MIATALGRPLFCLLLSAAALAAGCQARPAASGGGSAAGASDPYYSRYTGPLQVGRSYEYSTVEQNTFTEVGGDYDPAVSPDGRFLVYASTCHAAVPDIYVKSVRGATVSRLTNTPEAAEIQPCFSPDGKRVAYATNDRGNWDIHVQNVEGGGKPVLATPNMKSDEISPCFHPGGEWIAFSTMSPRTGTWEIAVRNLLTGQLRYLGEGLYPRFSPDGRKIAFQRARSREPRWYSIWTLELDADFNSRSATEVVSSAKWAAINPAWSPDGKYLAFATVHESPLAQGTRRILMGDDIWVVNLEGQDLTRLTDGEAPESHPVWSRDAELRDRVYFCSMMKGPKNIWSLSPRMPEPYGSVQGRLPGPPEKNPPPPARPPADPSGADRPGTLPTYLAPPPPAVSAGGAAGE
jgi:Tol biopolymer transport system component